MSEVSKIKELIASFPDNAQSPSVHFPYPSVFRLGAKTRSTLRFLYLLFVDNKLSPVTSLKPCPHHPDCCNPFHATPYPNYRLISLLKKNDAALAHLLEISRAYKAGELPEIYYQQSFTPDYLASIAATMPSSTGKVFTKTELIQVISANPYLLET